MTEAVLILNEILSITMKLFLVLTAGVGCVIMGAVLFATVYIVFALGKSAARTVKEYAGEKMTERTKRKKEAKEAAAAAKAEKKKERVTK